MFICFTIILVFVCLHETFSSVVPIKKPSYELSAAMERLCDQWNPHEDLNNELYSNFVYAFEWIRENLFLLVVIQQKLLSE